MQGSGVVVTVSHAPLSIFSSNELERQLDGDDDGDDGDDSKSDDDVISDSNCLQCRVV